MEGTPIDLWAMFGIPISMGIGIWLKEGTGLKNWLIVPIALLINVGVATLCMGWSNIAVLQGLAQGIFALGLYSGPKNVKNGIRELFKK